MKLALRRTDAKTFFGKLFNQLTRVRLQTEYPHGGIVIDNRLFHVTYTDGLHSTEFNPEDWDLFDVVEGDLRAMNLFSVRKGAKYDALSLLAFMLPWRIRDSRRLYCFEWCWLALTGVNPSTRITPEKLLVLVNKMGARDAAGGSMGS